MRRLVLADRHWKTVIDSLTADREAVVLGPTGIRIDGADLEILVRDASESRRDGIEAALLRWSDLLCFLPTETTGSPGSLTTIVRTLGLDRARRATVVWVGVGAAAGRAGGFTALRGEILLLDEIRVANGGARWRRSVERGGSAAFESRAGLAATPTPAAKRAAIGTAPQGELARIVPERWSRTAGALSEGTWLRIRDSRIALVGCGRSGSVAAELFVREGVHAIDLIDPDLLEEGNLDAMLGAASRDVGQRKVDVVQASIVRAHPDTEIATLSESGYAAAALRVLRRADLIVTTTDRDAPRLAASHLASAYLKPHLDIGTGVFRDQHGRRAEADVRFLVPGEGCILCVGGLRDEPGARRELLEPAGVLREPRLAGDWRAERAGSLLTLNATAVARGVQLWNDFLAGHVPRSRWIRYQWDESSHEATSDTEARANSNCAICEALGLGDYRFGAG
jgi:hypothetical protein